ncbi:hypothetical protein DERP_000717 [Dermatophagoides pteronyssinus]|uniref:Uncharacterized protein n=1 Tax=Dermatophagoides pteronyssinus TaxID=6956 RepID=A0ABQ8J0Z2_DERPT|nr:hypothetical protein DERP_000717 [Dermatophagoides pteronyssinus]
MNTHHENFAICCLAVFDIFEYAETLLPAYEEPGANDEPPYDAPDNDDPPVCDIVEYGVDPPDELIAELPTPELPITEPPNADD